MIYDKDYDERDKIGYSNEDVLTDDTEVSELGKLSLQKNIDNIEKESDKIIHIYMLDERGYYERYQIGGKIKLIRIRIIRNL